MVKMIICSYCGENRGHYAKGLCRPCYQKTWRGRLAICLVCGEEKLHCAKGLCKSCYMIRYYMDCGEYWRKVIGGGVQRYENKGDYLNERRRENVRKSRKMNPEEHRLQVARYRANKRNLPSTLTSEEIGGIMIGICFYCGDTEPTTIPTFIMEHWIPASKGGGFTRENIVCACGLCNGRKYDRTPEEFLRYMRKIGVEPAGTFIDRLKAEEFMEVLEKEVSLSCV